MGKSPVGQKGYTGNPNGRPKKGQTLTDALRESVDKHEIAKKLVELALEKGDIGALKYIYDRIDGRPVETVNQTIIEHSNPILSALREIIDGPQPETDRLSTDEQS